MKKHIFLTLFKILFTSIVFCYVFVAFKEKEKDYHIDEITVKRLNIVDESGEALRMVISNETRQHSGILNGKEMPQRERPAGIIFFNSVGDECGGLLYNGNDEQAGMVLSIDQYRDDQIMQLQYQENTFDDKRKYGLQIWDYKKEDGFDERYERYLELNTIEDKELREQRIAEMKSDSLWMEDRMFVGKNFQNQVGLFIKDQSGNARIRVYIDENDEPKFELLDKEGNVLGNK
ncbi:hypothetical protein H8B06_06240 [Sphingobacterium sp. DN00404]|uniref:Uncharacterized protein n=1 Tax=Sphingobacterium micropteri TaxID=2763501 RepID=A0ABR7YM91_9SPHI|nr:hypothetical protein [Sphingobacterium micropteri]MBD1432417.1 hypothetical protein [Sphingobacterium micropteri]